MVVVCCTVNQLLGASESDPGAIHGSDGSVLRRARIGLIALSALIQQ